VLCSAATAGLVRERVDLVDLGERRLRDLAHGKPIRNASAHDRRASRLRRCPATLRWMGRHNTCGGRCALRVRRVPSRCWATLRSGRQDGREQIQPGRHRHTAPQGLAVNSRVSGPRRTSASSRKQSSCARPDCRLPVWLPSVESRCKGSSNAFGEQASRCGLAGVCELISC
jgi:hypothetical protein